MLLTVLFSGKWFDVFPLTSVHYVVIAFVKLSAPRSFLTLISDSRSKIDFSTENKTVASGLFTFSSDSYSLELINSSWIEELADPSFEKAYEIAHLNLVTLGSNLIHSLHILGSHESRIWSILISDESC